MKRKDCDPRTKLTLVAILSTFALIYNRLSILLSLLIVSILLAISIGSDLKGLVIRLKKLIYLVLVIAVVQSIFTRVGDPIISIGDFHLITDYGIRKSLEFILRISIIIVSSAIITTSTSREIVQGLTQMKLPYEIAFMVSIGIRFLPIFKEEMVDSVIAIQLRGIDLKKLKIKDKIKVYRYIFSPIVVNSILKAKELSVAMEMRGFRAYDDRTSYMLLKMELTDYIIIGMSFILAITAVLFIG